MDIRVRKLHSGDRLESLSRSLPTSVKPSCFQQCLNSSTDSIPDDLQSPNFGQYRKLLNQSECDVCHTLTKEAMNLKCFHTFCKNCIETHRILKNGCPACLTSGTDTDESDDKLEESNVNEDFIFGNSELEGSILEDLLEKLEFDVLNSIERKHDAIKSEIDRLHHDVDKEIAKIREYAQNLKFLIDRRAESMIKSATDSNARHCSELSRQMKTLKGLVSKIKLCITEHRNNIHWPTLTDIETKRKVETNMKNFQKLSMQVTEENVHIKFNTKALSDASLDFMGKVGVRVFLAKPLTVTLLKTFQFPGAVHSIWPVNSGNAWIGYQNFIQLCSKSGRHGKAIDIGEDVHDICGDGKQNIFIACESSIKRFDTHGRLTTLFECTDTPLGIACQDNGNIIACIGSEVIVFTQEGKRVSVFEETSGIDLKLPYKVSVNANGDICVSDYHSSSGEIVVFESSGKPKAKLRTEGMTPRGLACNMQGIIYITDFRSDRVNLYSAHGHFLQTLVSAGDHGISGPLSIALDASGDLWIGDWKRKVRIYSQSVAESCSTDD